MKDRRVIDYRASPVEAAFYIAEQKALGQLAKDIAKSGAILGLTEDNKSLGNIISRLSKLTMLTGDALEYARKLSYERLDPLMRAVRKNEVTLLTLEQVQKLTPNKMPMPEPVAEKTPEPLPTKAVQPEEVPRKKLEEYFLPVLKYAIALALLFASYEAIKNSSVFNILCQLLFDATVLFLWHYPLKSQKLTWVYRGLFTAVMVFFILASPVSTALSGYGRYRAILGGNPGAMSAAQRDQLLKTHSDLLSVYIAVLGRYESQAHPDQLELSRQSSAYETWAREALASHRYSAPERSSEGLKMLGEIKRLKAKIEAEAIEIPLKISEEKELIQKTEGLQVSEFGAEERAEAQKAFIETAKVNGHLTLLRLLLLLAYIYLSKLVAS